MKGRKPHTLAKRREDWQYFTLRIIRFDSCISEDANDEALIGGVDPDRQSELLENLLVERLDAAQEVDSEEESELTKSEPFKEAADGINFTLTPDIVQEYTDRLNGIGPTPSIESLK